MTMNPNLPVNFSAGGKTWGYPTFHLLAAGLKKDEKRVTFYFSTEAVDVFYESADTAVQAWEFMLQHGLQHATTAAAKTAKTRHYRDPDSKPHSNAPENGA